MDNDNLVTDAYGINPLPTTITVDKDGKIKQSILVNFLKANHRRNGKGQSEIEGI